MRHRLIWPMAICLLAAGAALAAAPKDMVGTWLGTLEVPGGKLRLALHLIQGPDGALTATMDSLDQGANGLPVDTVTVDGDTLRIEMKMIGGSFEGIIAADGKSITGTWRQSGSSFPLILERVDKVPEPNRPQEPKRPYPYREEAVTFENAAAGVKLAGALTFPTAGGPFPAVLLITGSGPEDRDETVFGHKPFLVLSDYLTRRGLAVLRVDDRGVGGSTGGNTGPTTEDLVGDALAGVAFLKTRAEVDPKRIGLLGHSEGGLIAPLAATRSPDVAFIVVLAAPGVPGRQVLLAQQELISRALGMPEEMIAQQRAEMERVLTIAETEKDNAVAEKQIREVMAPEVESAPADQRALAEAQVTALVSQVLSPWFRFFLSYDPAPTLAKVKVPVLAIWGEKDLQVPPKQNLPPVEKALQAAGNQHFLVKELPGLNHLFQTATTGSPTEYTSIEETMSPAALQLIGDWIAEQTKETRDSSLFRSPTRRRLAAG